MIISGNSSINNVYYSGYTISKIYACGGSLVWSGDTPIENKLIIITTSGTTYNRECDEYDFINDSIVGMQVRDLQHITIGDCVSTITPQTFNYAINLVSIDFGNTVQSIGSAFQNCYSLESIVLPDSLTDIHNAFYNCSGLTSVTFGNQISTIGDSSFEMCVNLESVALPNSVIEIENEAFYNCSGLTSVTFGNQISKIGPHAFENCKGLTELNIPETITLINNHAFENCSGLSSITVNAITPPIIGSATFYNTNNSIFYVPDESVTLYKNTSNWSVYADRIFPLSQKP